MGRAEVIRGRLPDRLAALAVDHQVPGAVVGVLSGGEIIEAAYGVLNKTTGVPVTTDSLFQVGSITDPDPAGRCRLLYLSRAVPRTGDA
jgi:hypothetical protein